MPNAASNAALRAPASKHRAARSTGMGLALAVVGVAGSAGAAQAQDYVVQPGDTVSHIALRTSSTVSAIVSANGLDSRASIKAGQHLVIPTAQAAVPVAAPAPAVVTHTVAAGDTVSALARRHGTTTAAIISANGLAANALIRIGQVLTIPAGGAPAAAQPAAAAPAPQAASHTVVAGDTVSGLAARYGTTTSAIVSANGLGANALIRIGQVLSVPGASAAPTAAPTTALVGSTFAGRTYPAATVASANANKATLLSVGVPSKAEMQQLVVATAQAMGVDPALAQAVAYQESGFNHASVSPANAIGTMQVIPTSGQWASDLVGRPLNLLDPQDNVTAGVAILRQLVATSPDLPTAIAGYYQGAAGVAKYGMYPDTRRYVANVQTHMSRYA
ncbi:LysM peptidoglycan-binding domain-containing protein [Actinotalea ferrariae]|uniref:LysM peptidoglycan-binding domain-containing protein n=1 Tax=Actinotalea ferrariae TaxID=1386098 RepID=UPI001C8BFA9C|nr:LysM peptidoglycan-binding domain-containing protein [Actinotalea ferrariae]MBX9243671.1 LysM peptidoglycan-binding domain-containing protein [Actinotalea ferrariae]